MKIHENPVSSTWSGCCGLVVSPCDILFRHVRIGAMARRTSAYPTVSLLFKTVQFMRIITLEDHFTTSLFREAAPPNPALAAVVSQRGKQAGVDIAAELLDLGSSRLAAMDAAGIDLQVVSLTAPGCEALDAETAVPIAKDANDRLSEAVRGHPDRLAGFAALPTADPDAAAEELERTVRQLGLKGAMINGHVRAAISTTRNTGAFSSARRRWMCRSNCIRRRHISP
jgi:Amidohydrolase